MTTVHTTFLKAFQAQSEGHGRYVWEVHCRPLGKPNSETSCAYAVADTEYQAKQAVLDWLGVQASKLSQRELLNRVREELGKRKESQP